MLTAQAVLVAEKVEEPTPAHQSQVLAALGNLPLHPWLEWDQAHGKQLNSPLGFFTQWGKEKSERREQLLDVCESPGLRRVRGTRRWHSR